MQHHVGNAAVSAQPSAALLVQLPMRAAAELAAAAATIDRLLGSSHAEADQNDLGPKQANSVFEPNAVVEFNVVVNIIPVAVKDPEVEANPAAEKSR